jgi:hypothetical protein
LACESADACWLSCESICRPGPRLTRKLGPGGHAATDPGPDGGEGCVVALVCPAGRAGMPVRRRLRWCGDQGALRTVDVKTASGGLIVMVMAQPG